MGSSFSVFNNFCAAIFMEHLYLYYSIMRESKLHTLITTVYNFVLECLVVDFGSPNDKQTKSIVGIDNLSET